MSTSTDGQLSFGYDFSEEYDFPWQEEDKHGGDIDEWWLDVNGFNPSVDIFADGFKSTDEQDKIYWEEKREFNKKYPLPVELVWYCSGDYPMYIISLPNLYYNVSRGEYLEITKDMLQVSQKQIDILKNFCDEYNIEYGGEPKWLMTSYWG